MSTPETPEAHPAPIRARTLVLALATVGGIGLIPLAPGTWGSLAGLVLGLGLVHLLGVGTLQCGLFVATVGTAMIGLLTGGPAGRALGRKDPGSVVIDEVSGMLLALAILPPADLVAAPVATGLLAMALFRLFDIVKPWPVCLLEALPGGIGIVADDLLAGAVAGILTTAVIH